MSFYKWITVCVLLFGCFSCDQLRKNLTDLSQNPAVSQRIIGKDSLRIEVFVTGRGEPLVLVPEDGQSADEFHDFAARIAQKGFRVVYFNPRGIGNSTGPLDDITLHTLSADVWMIVDSLHLGRINLLGFGSGQRVSRCVSADRSEYVRALIGVGGACVNPALDTVPVTRYRTERRPSGKSSPTIISRVANLFKKAALTTQLEEWYTGGPVPLLIIQGLEDKELEPDSTVRFAARRPHTTVYFMPGLSEDVLTQQPQFLTEQIASYILWTKDQL